MTMCQGSRNGNRRSIQVIYFDSQQASEDKDTGKPNEIERLTFGLERGCRKSTATRQLAGSLLYFTYGCVSREGWHVQQETNLPG